MTDPRNRAPRTDTDEPAEIHAGEDVYAGRLENISDTGAAVGFDFTAGAGKTEFNIGNPIEVDVEQGDTYNGRVVRHYESGFAIRFEDDEQA